MCVAYTNCNICFDVNGRFVTTSMVTLYRNKQILHSQVTTVTKYKLSPTIRMRADSIFKRESRSNTVDTEYIRHIIRDISTDAYVQRGSKRLVILAKQDPGRARQISQAWTGRNFTKPRTSLLVSLWSLNFRLPLTKYTNVFMCPHLVLSDPWNSRSCSRNMVPWERSESLSISPKRTPPPRRRPLIGCRVTWSTVPTERTWNLVAHHVAQPLVVDDPEEDVGLNRE